MQIKKPEKILHKSIGKKNKNMENEIDEKCKKPFKKRYLKKNNLFIKF